MALSPTSRSLTSAGTGQLHSDAGLLYRAGLALLGTVAIAAAAHVSVPLPFTTVPFTLQPLAVLLVGLLLGPSLAFSTLCLYLIEGAVGLPVFQPHGPGGLLQLAGPTGGFLMAYPFVAALAGMLFRRLPVRSTYIAAALAGTAAVLLLFTVGAARYGSFYRLGLLPTLTGAVLPFLPGEFIKILAAAGIASAWQNRARPLR